MVILVQAVGHVWTVPMQWGVREQEEYDEFVQSKINHHSDISKHWMSLYVAFASQPLLHFLAIFFVYKFWSLEEL